MCFQLQAAPLRLGISAELEGTRALLDSFKGTMCYMSPERIENKDYDFSADIWSLGLTLLECAVVGSTRAG